MNTVALGTPDPGWRRVFVAAGLLLAGVLFLYRDTGLAMVAIWSRSDTFAHAWLVPPIVVWLVWRQRDALAAQAPRPTAWALLPVAVASAAWLLGDLAASNAVAQLAFTALLIAVVVATIGPRASRTIAFPFAFLFFSVPVGEFVMPQMMQWTADFTVFALQLTGIPVYREGLQFVVPSGNWSVVEACSGIRYLIASIMVGTLFAYLNYRSFWRRLVFTGISIVVPIVANWIRAYLIVLIGDISGNVAAVDADHLVYGWAFFAIVITVMFLIGARWSEPPAVVRAAARPAPSAASHRFGRSAVAVGLAAAVLLVLPHLVLRGTLAFERPGAPSLAAPAALGSGWSLQPGETSLWRPAFSGAAAEFNRRYVRAGSEPIGVHIGYYRHQDYATKLVSSENRIATLDNPDWSAIRTGGHSLAVDGAPRDFEATSLRAAGHVASGTPRRVLVWKTYWIDGKLTANDAWAKLYIAFERLRGRGDDAAVVIVYREVDADSLDDAALAAFVERNLGALTALLARTRDDGSLRAPASGSPTPP